MTAMAEASMSKKGYSCQHDCGPHASCRCGMCVAGGNTHPCLIPECVECQPHHYKMVMLCMICLLVAAAQLIYAMLRVLLTLNKANRFNVAGKYKVCLFNPALYTSATPVYGRSHHTTRCKILFKLFPWLRLPSMLLFIFSILCLFVVMEIVQTIFFYNLNMIYDIIPEEFYPSDHLFLTSQIRIPER